MRLARGGAAVRASFRPIVGDARPEAEHDDVAGDGDPSGGCRRSAGTSGGGVHIRRSPRGSCEVEQVYGWLER